MDILNYSLGIFAPKDVTLSNKNLNDSNSAGGRGLKSSYINLSQNEFYCQYYDLVTDIREAFIKTYGDDLNEEKKRAQIKYDGHTIIETLFDQEGVYTNADRMKEYEEMIYFDLFGLGVLEPILNDETITEIMVVSHDKIFLEKDGNPFLSEYKFPSYENALGTVRKIIEPLNKRLNYSQPSVDAQLPDGSRLSASIPPVKADGGISITIRKFPKEVKNMIVMHDLYGNASLEMIEFLENCVNKKVNIIASGGTGSGKTTLLNALSTAIPARERLLTCEDTKELQLLQPHVEAYMTVSENMEGKGEFSMRDIIVAALRKRPDRIIVGECRGGEIVEMLNAMNTGHDGSLSTIHANNPKDLIKRATTMILSNESTKGLPQIAILQLLASAVNLIIQTSRLQDGSRRIVNITEVLGTGFDGWRLLADKLGEQETIKLVGQPKEDQIYMYDIFKFIQYGQNDKGEVTGWYESTGYRPYLLDKMIMNGSTFKYMEVYETPTKLLEVTGKFQCGYERVRNVVIGDLPVKWNSEEQKYTVREDGDFTE